jgi:hypothetical protein
MCFGNYRKKNNRFKNKIYPLNDTKKINQNTNFENKKQENLLKKKQREEFHNRFIREIISCGYCNEKFNLGSNKLQINCGGCDKFFHCHIAGKCKGKNCSIEMPNGSIEYISYCMDCSDILTIKNGYCLCKKCSSK